ncbi:caspase family protein [Desulfomarina sp.]
MKLKKIFISVILFLVTPCIVAAADQGTWKALIIGIGDYQDRRVTDLRTPVSDGRELAKILSEGYGFEVTTLFDRQATWDNIDTALRKLIVESTEDDSVLIYYGGHGDLDEELGEGWWYPVDAVPGKRQTYLKNSDLRELIKRMPARHVLLVSDSCFAGSLFGDYRSFSAKIDDRYHQRLYRSKSRQGLTSGGKEPVLDGGSEGHSIFAYHFLKFLRTTDRDIFSVGELFTQIAPVVTNNSIQKPECLPILFTGHEQGEFVFVRSGADIKNYVSSTVVTSLPRVKQAGNGLKQLRFGSGLAVGFVLLSLFLLPRVSSRRKEKHLARAIAKRDGGEIMRMLKSKSCRNEDLLAEAKELVRPAAGLMLEGIRQVIVIAPGPRQGVGRGERWPLSVSDPHVSRKPHGWLLLSDGGFSINSDGGEIMVNDEPVSTSPLKEKDCIAIGPVTVLVVERAVHGKGMVLAVRSGPEKGKRLVLLGGSAPLHWITGQRESSGSLSWRQGRPCISVKENDSHPLAAGTGCSEFLLAVGDVLRVDEQDWMVKIL